MKRLLLLIPIFLLLSSCSYSQWWTSGGNALWPHGRVHTKSLLVYDSPDSYIKAISLLEDQLDDITALFYRNAQVWRPLLRTTLAVDSASFNGETHILPALFTAELTMNHGNQNSIVFGSQSYVKNKVSGTFNWGPFSEIRGVTGEIVLEAPKGNVPNATGVASVFSSEATSTDTINLGVGFWSDWNRWGSGSTHVNKFYSFHSSLGGLHNGGYVAPGNVTIDTFYHFYGKGNYPSYFGGDLVADGDIIKFEKLPSDSSGLATGQLYFDSNGFLKRKF